MSEILTCGQILPSRSEIIRFTLWIGWSPFHAPSRGEGNSAQHQNTEQLHDVCSGVLSRAQDDTEMILNAYFRVQGTINKYPLTGVRMLL